MRIKGKITINDSQNMLRLRKDVREKLDLEGEDVLAVVPTKSGFTAKKSVLNEHQIKQQGKIPAGIVKQGNSFHMWLREDLLMHLDVEDGDHLMLDVIDTTLLAEIP